MIELKNRTYPAVNSSDSLWVDMKDSVKFVKNYINNSPVGALNFFELNLQTCPATPSINRNAFLYAFSLENMIPSVEKSPVYLYIIQPPSSLNCAIIDKEKLNIVEQKQFGKIFLMIGERIKD